MFKEGGSSYIKTTEKNGEQQEITRKMHDLYQLLIAQKGEEGARDLINLIAEERPPALIDKQCKRMANIHEAIETGLEEFEKAGFIEYDEEGKMICDIDKFKTGVDSSFIKKIGPIYSSKHLGENSMTKTIHLLFKDKAAISKEDYEKGSREEKPLFYLPKNKDDALDINKIKESSFYLHLGEVAKNPQYSKGIKYGDIKDLDYREVLLPLLIYHPKYLNGYRENKTNELKIKDEAGDYEKLKAEHLIKKFSAFGSGTNINSNLNTPRLFVRNVLPNLIDNNILLPEDFAITNQSDINSLERQSKNPGKKGYAMFNSVRYTLGSEYESKKGFTAHQLSNELGGIVKKDESGRTEIISIFNLLNEKDDLKSVSSKTGQYWEANAKQCDVRKFDMKKMLPQKPGETDDDYAERINSNADFDNFINISTSFSSQTKINLVSLSFENQLKLVEIIKKTGLEKIVEFIKIFSEDGLKMLINFEGDDNYLDKLLSIGDKADPKITWTVLRKYNQIINLAESNKVKMHDIFKNNKDMDDKDVDLIINSLIKKAEDILIKYTEKLTSEQIINDDEILSELEKIDSKILLLDQVVRQLPREEVAELNLREISEIEKVRDMPAVELLNNTKLLNKILKIISQQFPAGDTEAFLDECRNNKNLTFTISMAGGEPLCFFSKEKKSDNINYIDWFIANPGAPIKGLGEATIKLEFTGWQNSDEAYYAVTKPHAKSFEIFVERLGFVSFGGSTEDDEYKHHYARCRKLPADKKLASKNLPSEGNNALKNILNSSCQNPNMIQPIVFEGASLKACLVEYHGQTSQDDIKKTDPDGWLLNEIERQYEKGFILSRYIPLNSEDGNQSYYAIFEKNPASKDEEEKIWGVINHADSEDGRSDHSDSKKALSI